MADRDGRRTAIILYGTETGQSQDIAYELDQTLQRLHFDTIIQELDETSIIEICEHDLALFAVSTTGQGEFPSNSRKFWLSLLKKKLGPGTFSNVCYGMVGLCDSSYPKFNLAARKLNKRLQQLGADSLLPPCEADEQGEEGTEGHFLAWLPQLVQEVQKAFPLPSGVSPINPSQKLESPWILASSNLQQSNGIHISSNNGSSAVISVAASELPFDVVLEENTRVTPASHWQDVRVLKLRSGLPVYYLPGDALAIRPQNSADDVDQILDILGWRDHADGIVSIQRNSKSASSHAKLDPSLSRLQQTTLRQLLTTVLDINAIPKRSFFSKISHYTSDEMQKERALEFADPQFLDEYFDYATRPRRSILEVLQEFHTIRIPWQEAINVFPILRPRQFSVASGGTQKSDGHVFELLVAIVKYKTVIKRIREGVCTKYLARLTPGMKVNVVLHTEGRFQKDVAGLDNPHLLIAGGTGIAPIRSLLQEKISAKFTDSTLVFGSRSEKADFFYGNEWSTIRGVDVAGAQPSLSLITAFSRDQARKVYVQDRIKEHAAEVARILLSPQGEVVVCGSSGAMPKAVRQALKDVLCSDSAQMSEGQAEAFLAGLEKTARYKQETW